MKKVFGNLFKRKPKVPAVPHHPNDPKRYKINDKAIGSGTFGSVYKGKDLDTGGQVAVKKIPADPPGEAELNFNMQFFHVNVVRLLGHYREARKHSTPAITDLCLVMEYSKNTLKDVMDEHKRKPMPQEKAMLYTYQIFRALNYIHVLGIMHRDVKPSNFLVDKKRGTLKMCDFGSANRLVRGEARNPNVVSRPYRAPELELGNQDYDEKIDIWAAGCVLTECCISKRLFLGKLGDQHYQLICDKLGDPSLEDIHEMLPLSKGQKFKVSRRRPPVIEPFLRCHKPPLPLPVIALIKKILQFRPSQRPSAIEICADPYYDKMREKPDHDKLLYDFSEPEIAQVPISVLQRLVPARCRNPHVLKRLTGQQLIDLRQESTQKSSGSGYSASGTHSSAE